MIVLDLKDSRPLYEQIVERFKHLILCGALPEDEKMPSVRNLAMELSINPNTIQKAYGELEREGFIYSVKGRGNFVASSNNLKEAKKRRSKTADTCFGKRRGDNRAHSGRNCKAAAK